ncbi:MAG: SusC/RagA family TonB-linked outer membrane protein [Clostridium sp.]|nr:SusC/RagA family TonB-linked outer membrane protein [Bacteroides sp.]MCM1199131.1 SusC/RagA family TonB-linked outer membrane protein [Clostridium sp.]
MPGGIYRESVHCPRPDNGGVTGTVLDNSGNPVIGAGLVIKGTQSGVTTDLDGQFTLSGVKSGDIIQVSCLGYEEQEIIYKGEAKLNVVLQESSLNLDGVVVTALGIKRSEKALSYNVQQVNSDEITAVKDANFMNSLAGKVAGVNINASANGPGGASRVVMRGVKSLTQSNQALYVIDGVPISNSGGDIGSAEGGAMYAAQPGGEGISDLNPEDIESISVLSGPAAAALYGSSAANGVILITTKKGTEGKVKVTFTNNTTFSSPFRMPEFQSTYGNRTGEFYSWGEKGTAYSYNPADFFHTGSNVNNAISVSIGNSRNQTYFSASTNNSDGTLPNNTYNRYNFTVRNTTKFLKDKMTFDAGLNYIIQDQRNMVSQGIYFNPLEMVYLWPRGEDFNEVRMYKEWDPSRNIYVQRWNWQGVFDTSMENPYWEMYEKVRETKKNRYIVTASLSYDILDWLNISGRVRMDNTMTRSENKYSASTNTYWTSGSDTGYYGQSRGESRQLYADALVNINKAFEKWSISANIGTSLSHESESSNGYGGPLSILPNVFNVYNIDKTLGSPSQANSKRRDYAVFASAEVGFRNMLFLTVTARNEWSSTLANTSQLSYFFPSVGLSGVISQMAKMPEWIDFLKVRASYADVGSPLPINLTGTSYIWNATTQSWVLPSYRPLTKLYPEKTSSWEAGVNFRFLHHFNLDVTWYLSDTKNQTLTVNTSAAAGGYTSMYVQTGNVRNCGIEASLGYSNTWKDFNWDTNLTFSSNRNRITELLDDYYDPETDEHYHVTELRMGSNYLVKGGSMGDVYATKDFARDSEGNMAINSSTGNVMAVDLGSNPRKLGSVLPKANLGWSNAFSYKGINLNILFTARIGGIAVSQTQAFLDYYGVSKASADARDAGGIRVNGGIVDAEGYYKIARDITSEYTYDATTVRLQELSIGYTLPSKWFKDKMTLNLSLIGRNLWLIYCKAPFDPETTASTGTYNQGYDYFMVPSLRNLGFSVKIDF